MFRLQTLRVLVLAGAALGLLTGAGVRAAGKPVQIVALGDSLSAGFELPADAAFPAVLERALRAAGVDASVVNAGVSGDTTQDGLERLDWSVPVGTEAVILELGANDMLRGQDPAGTQAALDIILTRLQARGIRVLLAGMVSLPSMGADYEARFKSIYPALARAHGVPLYPFFLQGVAQDAGLKLPDGMHPNAAGVAVIVKNILPSVEALVREVQAKR